VKQGLASIMEKPRPCLSDLLFKLDLSGRRLGTTDISWILCPAINAAGRMGKAQKALDLLMEKDAVCRDRLASELISMNEERKKIGEEIWSVAEPLAESNMESFHNRLAVAYGDNIPRGVTGIMANRLLGRFKVPSLVAAIGENIITASLRSVRGYDLRFLLEPLEDLFLDWGGHDFAAGFSLSPQNWDTFLARLKTAAAGIELSKEEDEETLIIDAELPLSFMTPDIFTLVDRFEPYGERNDALTFVARSMRIAEINLMGKPELKHVKLTMDAGKHKWPAVYWNAADKAKRDFDLGDTVDLVFKFGRNWFKGNETPQLIVSDLRRSGNKEL